MDKEKLQTYIKITKNTIILCWISLICFWIIKLFGGNWFEIAVNNENFVAFSNLVETTWLKYLVSFITIAVAKYLTFGAICQQFTFKGKQLAVMIFGIIFTWYCANFAQIDFIQMYGGYIVYILVGFVYQKGWKKSLGLIAIFFELAFSSLSLITRNIELQLITNYLAIMVLMLDMYIMVALYYLYSNLIRLKKEV